MQDFNQKSDLKILSKQMDKNDYNNKNINLIFNKPIKKIRPKSSKNIIINKESSSSLIKNVKLIKRSKSPSNQFHELKDIDEFNNNSINHLLSINNINDKFNRKTTKNNNITNKISKVNSENENMGSVLSTQLVSSGSQSLFKNEYLKSIDQDSSQGDYQYQTHRDSNAGRPTTPDKKMSIDDKSNFKLDIDTLINYKFDMEQKDNGINFEFLSRNNSSKVQSSLNSPRSTVISPRLVQQIKHTTEIIDKNNNLSRYRLKHSSSSRFSVLYSPINSDSEIDNTRSNKYIRSFNDNFNDQNQNKIKKKKKTQGSSSVPSFNNVNTLVQEMVTNSIMQSSQVIIPEDNVTHNVNPQAADHGRLPCMPTKVVTNFAEHLRQEERNKLNARMKEIIRTKMLQNELKGTNNNITDYRKLMDATDKEIMNHINQVSPEFKNMHKLKNFSEIMRNLHNSSIKELQLQNIEILTKLTHKNFQNLIEDRSSISIAQELCNCLNCIFAEEEEVMQLLNVQGYQSKFLTGQMKWSVDSQLFQMRIFNERIQNHDKTIKLNQWMIFITKHMIKRFDFQNVINLQYQKPMQLIFQQFYILQIMSNKLGLNKNKI